jgi:hypothetical protein
LAATSPGPSRRAVLLTLQACSSMPWGRKPQSAPFLPHRHHHLLLRQAAAPPQHHRHDHRLPATTTCSASPLSLRAVRHRSRATTQPLPSFFTTPLPDTHLRGEGKEEEREERSRARSRAPAPPTPPRHRAVPQARGAGGPRRHWSPTPPPPWLYFDTIVPRAEDHAVDTFFIRDTVAVGPHRRLGERRVAYARPQARAASSPPKP